MAKTNLPVLPAWASHAGDNKVEADPDKFYPAFMEELELKPADLDQYWLECIYQMMKMDLQTAMGKFGFAIHMLNRPKWALANYKEGKGIAVATKGHHAREHYRRLRGSIPV